MATLGQVLGWWPAPATQCELLGSRQHKNQNLA